MVEKFREVYSKYFSNGPKAAFVLSLVIIALVATIYSMRKTVTVVIDGKNQKLVTYKRTVSGALKDNRIEIGQKDKIEPSLDSQIGKDDIINIKKAVKVQVEVDGKEMEFLTAEDDIESMLIAENINYLAEDRISPSKDSKVSDGMKIDIVRVETKLLKDLEPINFNTVVKKDDNLLNSQNKTMQEGKSGEREVTTRVVYEDGKEVSRKVVSENVTKEPVDKIVLQGTLSTLSLSRGGGDQVAYKKSMKVKATAYYNSGSNGNHITATGTKPKRNPGGYSTIAVDPRIIPLGTKVWVEGYGYAIAEDTGGAIKGDKIDLFFNTSSEVYTWGVKYVNVYIIG
ncbi:G5 and 3D domain-containing protein [Clostridium hydrogeniformans]|uniref:G5 and 3D domain-containing protein n=1 Tax=Clostridium hydrogeniformans TaxID=349933 RepID=UPI000482D19F|nr:G5 and 3D domain-containing protein [Clostridium hydrogeniformans]